jgi:hypothetical protein
MRAVKIVVQRDVRIFLPTEYNKSDILIFAKIQPTTIIRHEIVTIKRPSVTSVCKKRYSNRDAIEWRNAMHKRIFSHENQDHTKRIG